MNSLSRNECLDRLRGGETWDILVIGGGATGLGTAVDAALRGYRTLLLEARDFAHGTSSRSTKLIHGGVRYLAQGNIPLVREALHERGLLLQNAPHLVQCRDFVVPAYHSWQLPYYGMGLWLYDRLAGELSLGRSRWISRAETLTRVPTMRSQGLRGGILYTDGQFDDARLAIVLARTLADLGGSALNYLPVTALTRQGGRLAGATARDLETGEEFTVTTRTVVNASGVNADEIRRLDEPGAPTLVAPSQGAHIVLDRSFLPGETAVMVPKTDDGRVLFAIPWSGRVLVGTTDTAMATVPLEPRPLEQEIDYLLDHARRYLEKAPSRADIKSAFAGLRPTIRPAGAKGSATSRLSREHVVTVSESGLVTVTGGKWTTYRVMARDAVDHAARVGKLPGRPSATASLRLHGWRLPTDDQPRPLALYGSDLSELNELIRERPDLGAPLHPALPYIAAEVVWAARHEAARMIEDVLARRTRALFLDARASLEAAPRVAALLAGELGRDEAWQADQVARFKTLSERYLVKNR
ncbi:MAG: glycerol-3-phosphate dehydrogenase/oxidase [Isosphaeraceae bacterium]